MLSAPNIDRYILRIGTSSRPKTVLALSPLTALAEEGGSDRGDDDDGDNAIGTLAGGSSSQVQDVQPLARAPAPLPASPPPRRTSKAVEDRLAVRHGSLVLASSLPVGTTTIVSSPSSKRKQSATSP